jgi:hypothetical protein
MTTRRPAALSGSLKGLKRYPVATSYFEARPADRVPAYTLAFDLYENGVSSALRLNYGNFALKGKLQSVELLAAEALRQVSGEALEHDGGASMSRAALTLAGSRFISCAKRDEVVFVREKIIEQGGQERGVACRRAHVLRPEAGDSEKAADTLRLGGEVA